MVSLAEMVSHLAKEEEKDISESVGVLRPVLTQLHDFFSKRDGPAAQPS